MGDDIKRPTTHAGTVFEPPARGLRARNEDHSHIPTPPRGVGLTQPPIVKLRPPANPVVPRREFDFEQKTPPAMDPDTYHALQTLRGEVLNPVAAILELVEAERKERKEREDAAAAERERRRKYIVPIITALGVAIAGIVAALVHGCAS